MKTITVSILLALATTQVNADGFYQQLIGSSPQASQQITSEVAEISYSPLYKQVTASVENLASQESIGPRSEITYTPLYLQVVGAEKPWAGLNKIAQN